MARRVHGCMARHVLLLYLALHLGSAPTTVSLELTKAHREALRRSELDLDLFLDGIEFEQRPSGSYAIYVGLPSGSNGDPEGPFFVGNVTFYGAKANQPFDERFDVETAVSAALDRDPQLDEIDVTFVPHAPRRAMPASEIRIQAVRFAAQPD